MGWKDNELYHKLGKTHLPSVFEVLQKLSSSESSKGHQAWCSGSFHHAHLLKSEYV